MYQVIVYLTYSYIKLGNIQLHLMSQFLFVLANLPCGKKCFLMHSRVLEALKFISPILE